MSDSNSFIQIGPSIQFAADCVGCPALRITESVVQYPEGLALAVRRFAACGDIALEAGSYKRIAEFSPGGPIPTPTDCPRYSYTLEVLSERMLLKKRLQTLDYAFALVRDDNVLVGKFQRLTFAPSKANLQLEQNEQEEPADSYLVGDGHLSWKLDLGLWNEELLWPNFIARRTHRFNIYSSDKLLSINFCRADVAYKDERNVQVYVEGIADQVSYCNKKIVHRNTLLDLIDLYSDKYSDKSQVQEIEV